MVMTIGIQGCMNHTSQSGARKTPQKNAEKQQIFTFLTAASCQMVGRTASSRTSAEPTWDGQ